MLLRRFDLDWGNSQIISVFQGSAGAELTVWLNDRLLGTLTTPAEISDGCDFKLDGGSTITVKMVGQQVQVRHNGLLLLPIRLKTAIPGDTVTKRVMLSCASIASVILLIAVWLVVSNLYKTPNPATDICLFRCVSGPSAPVLPTSLCFRGCPVTSTPTVPPPPDPLPPVLPDALLLGGWVLPTLIACFVGLRHALMNHARRWVAFGLIPALLLEILLLVFLLPLSQIRFSQDEALPLLLLFYSIVFLVPVVCLIYARSLPQNA